jgi:hypothetical protein
MDAAKPLIVVGALTIAALSARPYAGSWNDGSRLAAVEALADYSTFRIDHSVFVQVPAELVEGGHSPYDPDDQLLSRDGTRDKLLINGHYYSDKPPVVSVLMAGLYRLWQAFGGPRFAERPDLVCWFLTFTTSGLAYVLAVLCVYSIARRVGLERPLGLLLAGGLALSTVALPYTRHVNNHILLLGVSAALMLQLVHLRGALEAGRMPWGRLLFIGTLAGLGYNLDLGLALPLLAGLFVLVAYRCRRLAAMAVFVAGAVPWLFAHHLLNYLIGGTLGPANAVPEYLNWPGSPFTEANMTGLWRHGAGKFAVYSLALLFGKHGFIGHNLPLFLTLPAIILLLRRQDSRRPEVLFALTFCAGGWLMYAAFSNNYGGASCSVRWFVPFLAPGFYILAEFLRRHPDYRWDCCALCAWGALMGVVMWWRGPFIQHMVPMYWPIQAAGLVSWALVRRWRIRVSRQAASQPMPLPQPLSRAA